MAALDSGRTPHLAASHRYILQLAGRQYITLVDVSGPTPEGRFVYQRMGQQVPTDINVDQGQIPIRRGSTEWLKDAAGRDVKFRTLEADGVTWKYFSAGKAWASVNHAEVVVKMPVRVHGENDKGVAYSREEFDQVTYPEVQGLDRIALDVNLSDVQKDAAIIAAVKRHFGIQPGEETYIRESSNEVYNYDPTREHQWRVSKLITRPTDRGQTQGLTWTDPWAC